MHPPLKDIILLRKATRRTPKGTRMPAHMPPNGDETLSLPIDRYINYIPTFLCKNMTETVSCNYINRSELDFNAEVKFCH